MADDARPVIAGIPLRWREFEAPGRGAGTAAGAAPAFGVWVPDCDLDALLAPLTQEEFARSDERMPYFGAIWPAAEALVARLLAGPSLEGTHALDLGCGLGACGFAAARQGARVTFFDWEPRALEIVAASARAQAAPADQFVFVVGDWREPPPCGPFDLILGADVLYEARNGPAVAAFLARHLAPGGEGWLADPGRPHAHTFPALAAQEGLAIVGREPLTLQATGAGVTLLRLSRAG
ncbi:MAG TPA: class I SAM-dependent methyltransferase [Chloroflexota bacterium]|nr:class I SAM-dependent methyltransferase [Chloroflexota bacterium]